MAALLETQIRGGIRFPNRNIDITIDAAADLSAYQYRAVTINATGYGITPMVSASDFDLVGVLQNAPNYGTAIIRCAGITRIVYAAPIAAYELVQAAIDAGNEGKAEVWSPSKDGHSHSATLAEVVHTFFLCNAFGASVTGSTDSHFVKTLQSYSGGAFTTSTDTAVVTEASGGEYLAKYTPTVGGVMYRLMLTGAVGSPAAGAILTPAEFQEVPYASPGRPSNSTVRFVLGQALEDGIAGDEGLMILRPQLL